MDASRSRTKDNGRDTARGAGKRGLEAIQRENDAMNRWTLSAAATLGLLLGSPALQAESAPLSAEALARCANQVHTLRDESGRLTAKNAEFDQRRTAINQRSVALKAEREQVPPNDLQAGLAMREKLKLHHEQTLAFNASVEQLKREIDSLNALKRDYDGNCASRSYRRADLEALPSAHQEAMRAGLGGVQVPYIAP
jgi:hypothetical protein